MPWHENSIIDTMTRIVFLWFLPPLILLPPLLHGATGIASFSSGRCARLWSSLARFSDDQPALIDPDWFRAFYRGEDFADARELGIATDDFVTLAG